MAGFGPDKGGESPPQEEKLPPSLRFFQEWLRDPKSVAALAPSGRELARRMARACGRKVQRVVELGAGTGVITEALLERGVPREGILVLERNLKFWRYLRGRFPDLAIELADALELISVLCRDRRAWVGEIDAVVSGLGLLSLKVEEQHRLLEQVFAVLRPGGRFVQFTYLPRCPVPLRLRRELDLTARRVSWSFRNLPPAFIFVLKARTPQAAPLLTSADPAPELESGRPLAVHQDPNPIDPRAEPHH